LNNSNYYKSLKNLKEIIAKKGISAKINDELKKLRVMVIDEKQPLLAKTIRLIYQHIEKNDTFNVAIPEDEPIEGYEKETTEVKINAVESLDYLFSNMLDYDKKMNETDIRGFVADLKEQAGEDW
jgi:hypothetical protein